MMPAMDLVIQSADLPTDAVDAFRVACRPAACGGA